MKESWKSVTEHLQLNAQRNPLVDEAEEDCVEVELAQREAGRNPLAADDGAQADVKAREAENLREISEVVRKLSAPEDPFEVAASVVEQYWKTEEMAHV